MSLTEIVFWLFARLRPLLWYYHRLARFLEVAAFAVADEGYLRWLAGDAHGRADFESKLADGEHVLDVVVALRASEILGRCVQPAERPGIRTCARIHRPRSLEHLAARLVRLIQRFDDVERLARLRASRLRRASETAPVVLIADHRPQNTPSGPLLVLLLVSKFFRAPLIFACAFPAAPAVLHIRAPP